MFSNNNRCTADSITVYASPTFAFFSQYSRFSAFVNCKTQIKEGSKRLTTTCADGIMIHRDRLGPYISNCTLTCLGDDFINIHSFNRPIIAIPANDILELNACGEFKTGDRIGLIKVKNGKYEIIEVSRIKSVVTIYRNKDKFTRINLKSPLKQQFDESEIKQKQIQVFSPDIMSHGFVIRDSKFLYGVSRMLIGGRNGLIKNNEFKDNLNHHELLRIGMRRIRCNSVGELYLPRNIQTANNKFEVNYDKHFIEVIDPSSKEYSVCHLFITDNIFKNYRNSRGFSALKISGIDAGTITGNTFIPGYVRKSRYSGTTLSETAIQINNASNILIKNNKIKSNLKGQIQIGKETKNIIQK